MIENLPPNAIGLVAALAMGGLVAGWYLSKAHSTSQRRRQRPEHEPLVLQSKDTLLAVDSSSRVHVASPLLERWYGSGRGGLVGRELHSLFRVECRPKIKAAFEAASRQPGSAASVDVRAAPAEPHADPGLPDWLECTFIRTSPNAPVLIVHLRNIAARRAEWDSLNQEHAIFRTVFDAVPMSLYIKDLEGRYLRANRANLDRFGLKSESELLGKTAHDVIPPDRAEQTDATDRRVIETGEPHFDIERTQLAGPNDHRWFQTIKVPLRGVYGEITGVLGITSDVTERKQVERQLADQAAQDALTGLPNRRSLMERLTRKIEIARETREALAVIFCDLDFFKAINDVHGHEFGDQLLRALSQGIVTRLRPGDWIARFGGDEFVVVCHPLAGEIEGYRIASELLNGFRHPIHIQGATVRVDASIGIAFLRPDHARASDLIRDADAAMYLAKEQGRNRVAMFDNVLRKTALRRSTLDQALRQAVENEELSLVYQPKISLTDGRLIGFEALLRWNSEQHGLVSPASFIPLAEESGVILAIGRWVLEKSCRQLQKWQHDYPAHDDLTLAVNVSMRQLFQDGFLDLVREIVDEAAIYPNALELEITESTAMSNPQQTAEVLAQLKSMGLRIALDDFGTGYSSLAHLQKLPIDVIKIDRAFVHGISHTRENAEIARLVVAMARALGITSVAEGLETREDLLALKLIGADIAQGYLFSKPLLAHEADALLRMASTFIVH